MNAKQKVFQQKSRIYATFACLGKTYFAEKYKDLAVDLETSPFRYFIDEKSDIESLKSNPARKERSDFPQNYIKQFAKIFNKKAVILLPLSPEILTVLDKCGVEFSVIYPKKEMLPELIGRAKNRGNSSMFIDKISKNLSNNEELNWIKALNPKEVIFANQNNTIESILSEKLKDLSMFNSGFSYKGIDYSVEFHSLINREVPNEKWTQVYVVGDLNGMVPVVKYNKKGKASQNLPGGGTEDGETFEDTLKREVLEELNMGVVDFKPIGHQINYGSDGKIYNQLRVYAKLEKLGDFKKDIGGSVIGYNMVEIENLHKEIYWGEVGDWFSLVLKDEYEKSE